jgi:hypothetical protein
VEKDTTEKRSHDLSSEDYSNGQNDLKTGEGFDGTAHEAAGQGHAATDRSISSSTILSNFHSSQSDTAMHSCTSTLKLKPGCAER